jgi:lipid-A-disaccharide synthase
MKMCKQDVVAWQPDCLILVDYPGFNLKIAEYVKSHTNIPVYYYISPKIWAWKEYRIKQIKRDVDKLFSILPFEVDFFEKKHHYPIHYVGNPSADEVREYLQKMPPMSSPLDKPLIALLAGSRKQEIKDNLPAMLEAVRCYENDYQIVVAGAPGIEPDYYQQFMLGTQAEIVFGKTYDLLAKAHVALVTSGTATLETCLFGVPQVVCYKLPIPPVADYVWKHFLKVKYISLVNLVAGRQVVTELLGRSFTVERIRGELQKILSGPDRERMLEGYEEVKRALGEEKAPENAAKLIVKYLR